MIKATDECPETAASLVMGRRVHNPKERRKRRTVERLDSTGMKETTNDRHSQVLSFILTPEVVTEYLWILPQVKLTLSRLQMVREVEELLTGSPRSHRVQQHDRAGCVFRPSP